MNFLGSHNRERHRIFDAMQAETTYALAVAAQEGYLDPEIAESLHGLMADGFVPNIKHGVATMPGSLHGTEYLPIIPVLGGEAIEIAPLRADLPLVQMERTAAVTGLDLDFIRSLSASLLNNIGAVKGAIEFPGELAPIGLTNAEELVLEGQSDGSVHKIPLRRVVGVSKEAATIPGVVAHELRHAIDASEWPFSIPDFYNDSDRRAERFTYTERNAYAVTYALEQMQSGGMLPDYRKIGEQFRGSDIYTSFDDIFQEVFRGVSDPYMHLMPALAMVITHAFGPEDPTDFPTRAEVTGYAFAEIY